MQGIPMEPDLYQMFDILSAFKKSAEMNKDKLKTVVATMILNFGAEGRKHPGVITNDLPPAIMFVKICEFYENKIKTNDE